MRYAKLMPNDTVDTDSGICVSIWLQGCPFHCQGCHNQDTWDFNGGIEIDEDVLIEDIVSALKAYNIKRDLSILGGEPLCDENINFTFLLVAYIKNMMPDVKIYLWTGFEYSNLLNDSKYEYILKHVDVIVTGPYIQSKRNITLPLRGSSNQQIWRRNNDGILELDSR